MKKDAIRDYATEAFRFYAALGRPKYEDIKKRVYDYAMSEERRAEVKTGGLSLPTEYQLRNAENALEELEAELMDIFAVERTLEILSTHKNGQDIKDALEIVYFSEPARPLRRNEITNRVHFAEFAIHTTEPTVYRYLRIAREIFARERKLRSCHFDSSRFKLSDIMLS